MARRDAGEFTTFVLASQPTLRRTASLLCGDRQSASDHVQEALIRVYRHWPRLHGDAAAPAHPRKYLVSAGIDATRRRSSTEAPVQRIRDTTSPDTIDRPTARAPRGADPAVAPYARLSAWT